MNNAKNTLQVLKQELEFLEKGGYRSPIAWRWPLAFEDSPTCSNHRRSACPEADCVLMILCRKNAVTKPFRADTFL